jgi:hypothetical protein
MLIGLGKTDSLRRYLNINQQERGMWKDQEVDGRTNFELLNECT